jgi:ATP-dependent Clp protease ATP-binding subunit ClpX
MGEVYHFQECSFCGKHKNVVKKLIVGEGTAICSDCVELCNDLLKDEEPLEEDAPRKISFYADDIKSFLDNYIIGQDAAKTLISVAVSNHYKRVTADTKELEIQKANVLILGPSGGGKTLMAKTVAKYLDVPFVIADATSLTEAGYVGDDVESMIQRLVAAADGDIERAERGIIFVDEVDKIARKSESASITRDVSGEGVQQALLKIVEGTICRVPQQGKRKHPTNDMLEVDTKNILFISGGAFVGLSDIISRRLHGNSIGFSAQVGGTVSMDDILAQVTPDDLTKYGMIPEFTGRFTCRVSINELTKDQLVQILTKVKNNFIEQYQYLLSLDEIKLTFTDAAIEQIAENCLNLKTGARGLQSEVERVLLQVMFNSKHLKGKKIEIDKMHVDHPNLLNKHWESTVKDSYLGSILKKGKK